MLTHSAGQWEEFLLPKVNIMNLPIDCAAICQWILLLWILSYHLVVATYFTTIKSFAFCHLPPAEAVEHVSNLTCLHNISSWQVCRCMLESWLLYVSFSWWIPKFILQNSAGPGITSKTKCGLGGLTDANRFHTATTCQPDVLISHELE